MISIDTNIMYVAYDPDAALREKARAFLKSPELRSNVIISELILVEFYRLLRNPAVQKNPLSAREAVDVIQAYRNHPFWRTVGLPERDSSAFHDEMWRMASRDTFA